MKRFVLVVSAFLFVCAARDAAAQGFFINPFIGTTVSTPSTSGSASKPGVGVALGSASGFFGAEIEFAYYPELFDNTANSLSKSRVITFSGNTVLGPTIGAVKPYGAVGFGDLYLDVTGVSSIVVPNPANLSTNYFTFNVGGGVMGFFSSHLGVRGDVRYYRAFGFKAADVQGTGLALDRFDFWRAGLGLVARF